MKEKLLLLFLLILPLALSAFQPYSYVAPTMFGSYQFTIALSNGSNINQNTTGINPYTLPLQQVRLSIKPPSITLAGLVNANTQYCGFKISVAANISTQLLFALTVFDSAAFTKLSFFVILLGQDSTGYIETLNSYLSSTLISPAAPLGNRVNSPTFTVNTTIAAPYAYVFFLSFFRMAQVRGGSIFATGITNLGNTGQQISYNYYVDAGNSLLQIGFVLFVYSTGPYPTNVTRFGVFYDTYSNNLNNANAAISANGGGGFLTGYNDKCLLGHTIFQQSNTFSLIFNVTVVPGSVNYSSSDASLMLSIFCMVDYFNCSLIDSNCLECISYSLCSVCVSSYYPQTYTNVSTTCILCSSILAGCASCYNASFCLGCITPTYLQQNGTCLPCSTFITNCLNCTDNVTCTGCVLNYVVWNSTFCKLCSLIITGCQICSSITTCTQCLGGYYLTGSTCTLCSVPMPSCSICSSAAYCVLCSANSYQGPMNASCICNPGLYSVSNYCMPPGCSSAYQFNSSAVACLSCYTSNSFLYSGGACFCSTGYILNGNTCQNDCGDGLQVSPETCDDDNVISGDGCSSGCTVQTDYNCVNGSVISKSVCVYIGVMTVSLVNIIKDPLVNEATIIFSISPAIIILNSMNFNSLISLTISARRLLLTAQVIKYSSSYDRAGTLSTNVAYTSNLEGNLVNFVLVYDQTKVGLPPASLTFNMVGSNLPVLATTPSGLEDKVYYLGYFVAGLYLLVLLLSVLFHKMIGVQTMSILQSVYFIRYLLQISGPPAVYNINSMHYINLYNFFSQYTNVRLLDGNLLRMGLGKNFAFNVAIQVGLIIIVWLLWTYFTRKATYLKKVGVASTSLGMDQLKKVQTIESKTWNAGFIFTVYSFYLLAFGLLSSIQTQNEIYYQLPRLTFVFTFFVLIYALLFINAQMYLNWRPKYDQQEGISYKYVTNFLVYHISIAILIIGLYNVTYNLQIIAGVQIIYIILLIVHSPYFVGVQNVLLLISQIIGFLFTALLVAVQYITLSNAIMNYIMIGYEGLLIGVGVISMIRMYIHYKGNDKAFKLMHEEEDKLKNKDNFSKTEFKKQQEIATAQPEKLSLAQKKKLKEAGEIEELQRIRNRLKEEHKQKIVAEKEENKYEE